MSVPPASRVLLFPPSSAQTLAHCCQCRAKRLDLRTRELWTRNKGVSCSLTKLCLTVCDHGLQHAKLPCPLSPEVGSNSFHWVSGAIQPSYPVTPFFLLTSIFHSIRVFSSESALDIRWPEYWSFNFSVSPSSEYSGLISFRINWFHLEVLKSLLWQLSSKASILWHLTFPGGSDGKESACNADRPGFNPWVGKIPWRREWQPPPVFLPGEFCGQNNLLGYSPWGWKELDATEWLTFSLLYGPALTSIHTWQLEKP